MDALTETAEPTEALLQALLQALGAALRTRGWRLATAESCTGGLVAAACTALAGSSDWFDRGVVTYSNSAKTAQLGVDPALLAAHGAVSAEVAMAMAEGALALGDVQVAVSVTGIAGPGGAVPGKPVGTVWFATAAAGRPALAVRRQFAGDRAAVREAATTCALQLVAERLSVIGP